MSSEPMERIDYLSLVFRNDAEYYQDKVKPAIAHYHQMACDAYPRAGGIYTQVKRSSNGKDTLYIVESWGYVANTIALYMPVHWWLRTTRVDYRRILPVTTREQLRSWAQEQDRIGIKRANFQPFNKKDAHKTNKRGVGGAGGSFGSWKSGKSVNVYARLREPAAVEMRYGLPHITPVIREMVSEVETTPDLLPYGVMLRLLWEQLDKALIGWIGTHKLEEHIARLAQEHDDDRELVAAIKEARQSKVSGQMDFWSTVAEFAANERDTFTLISQTTPTKSDAPQE